MTAPRHAFAAETRPIGVFVHHQGRGHAERAAHLVNALPARRPVTLFSARDDIFPPLREGVTLRRITSLFEPSGAEDIVDDGPQPETVHCAPLGWPGIRRSMAALAGWMAEANPALMVCDVSAEVAQLARLCSVPHVAVLQHGLRGDPGHRAAYDGAAGLLAPCAEALAQPDWSASMRARTCFAGGLGVAAEAPRRKEARARLGIAADRTLALVLSGGGGTGFASAPLGVAARACPEMDWITLGHIARDWHATEPENLRHMGWVETVPDYLAAADLVVASTGNTTCHQILRAGKPWIAVPEWRYFDEQIEKARALCRAGAALHLPHLPSTGAVWREAIAACRAAHDPARQAALLHRDPAGHAARWLEALALRLHRPARIAAPTLTTEGQTP